MPTANFAVTIVGIILFLLALLAAVYNILKYHRSRTLTSASLLKSGPHAPIPQSPTHTGFQPHPQPHSTPSQSHFRRKSEKFRFRDADADAADKPLPSHPEDSIAVTESGVFEKYGWRWSLFGKPEQASEPIAKDNDPNFERIGLAH